jgi:acyl-CoA synthetase (AMP-forming)/AMP-acid ligase II
MQQLNRIFDYVDHWSRETPTAEAIVFEDRRLTYADFAEAVDATAKSFLALGVQPGDRVAMMAMACPEFLISFMAASKVGASWLGLNPKFSAREINYILSDCRPKVLITLDSYMGKSLADEIARVDLTASGVQQVLVLGQPWTATKSYQEATSAQLPEFQSALQQLAAQVDPQSEVLLMYTSGSTGQPKGVIQTHASILENVRQQSKYFFASQSMRALLHFPINHVAADVEIGFATVYAGGALVMMDRFDPAATLEILGREKITMFGQIPAMFLMQAALPSFKDTDFSSLKVIVWGGAAAPISLLRGLKRISQATGAKLITGYGSTEACGFITYTSPSDDAESLTNGVGRAPENFELRIVDDQRKPLATGQVGELAIRGQFLFKEYLNKPEATAQVIDVSGWYYTGDLGYLDADGALFLSGRKSEMYKSGGENVFPREIEEVLCEHPAVAMAAVIGVPDAKYQEVGYAFVLVRPGQSVTCEHLKEHCQAGLANFKVPKTFDLRPMLPLLPNGKVNKMELKRELEIHSNKST